MLNRSDRALSDPDISDGCASEPRGRRGESARISMMARCAYVASQRSRIYGSSPDHPHAIRILHNRRESIYEYTEAVQTIPMQSGSCTTGGSPYTDIRELSFTSSHKDRSAGNWGGAHIRT